MYRYTTHIYTTYTTYIYTRHTLYTHTHTYIVCTYAHMVYAHPCSYSLQYTHVYIVDSIPLYMHMLIQSTQYMPLPYILSTLYVPPIIYTHVIYTTYNTHHTIYYSLYVPTLYMPIAYTYNHYIATLYAPPYHIAPLLYTRLVCSPQCCMQGYLTYTHNNT